MTQITRPAQSDRAAAVRRSVPALGALRLGLAALVVRQAGEGAWLVAGREAALGLGALDAHRRSAPVSGWVGAMAVADGVDAAAFLAEAAGDRARRRRALWLAAFAASGLVAEGVTAYLLRRAGE